MKKPKQTKAEKWAKERKRIQNMSPEEREIRLAKKRNSARKHYHNMTLQTKEVKLAAARERYKNMSPEKREIMLARKRKKRQTMSPMLRAAEREKRRRWEYVRYHNNPIHRIAHLIRQRIRANLRAAGIRYCKEQSSLTSHASKSLALTGLPAWDSATDEDKKKLFALPNFDPVIFKELSGIDVSENANRKRALMVKADELIAKANELKAEADRL